jgi:DNA polymerase-3 subunit alpha (Gram-positive type)
MHSHDYVVLDIETTGLSKHRHDITEIAAVKYRGGKKKGEFQSLVNPGGHIPSFITRLTGIDDEMVKDAPHISKVLPGFLDFLGDGVIVAHNATFDYGFIHENSLRHLDKGLENERLCTRKLAYRLLPDLYSRKLGVVCEHLDIVNEQAHRAMGDVKATAEIFSKFLAMMAECGVDEKEEVMRFESSPAWKCRRLLEEKEKEKIE